MRIIILVVALLASVVMYNDASAQVNRSKQKHNFSSIGKRYATIRHGITLHVSGALGANLKQPMMVVPSGGIGYVATQYYGIANRFMQQSITYQFGYGIMPETFMVHNLVGTFHCSYLGTLDLNPVVYGIALQFAFADKSKTIKHTYANFYVRPEIGIALPVSYAARSREVSRVTAMITYGFNVKTFWNYNPVNEGFSIDAKGLTYPWTAMCHHVITVRINFNIGNSREMRK
jgi:hypothetical protein